MEKSINQMDNRKVRQGKDALENPVIDLSGCICTFRNKRYLLFDKIYKQAIACLYVNVSIRVPY